MFRTDYFAVHFKIDYVNADGSISNYYPDFIVKLKDGRVSIVETKGQEDLDVPLKMERLRQWCEDTNSAQSETTFDFVYVHEESFDRYKPSTFTQLEGGVLECK
ncbi:Type III restriction-modification enzyme helicase subunit [Rhodovulum sp. P5]|nr:Type III restriction-modification enzyme helicase subunit [Rhodovulum sp. P5]